MKFFIVPSLLLSNLFFSCESNERVDSPEKKKLFQYNVLYELKMNDKIKIDTTFIQEYSDSSAYLKGKVKFGRYVTDFEFGKLMNIPQPISFKVLNEKKEDVSKKLSKSTIDAIDSIAVDKISKEKNAVYDSTGNIRIIK